MPTINLIADEELAEITPAAEAGEVDAIHYFLGGHAERENQEIIDDFLSRHPITAENGSTVAEALYEVGALRQDEAKWLEYTALTANINVQYLSGEAALSLGHHYYQKNEYDEAIKWYLRAIEVDKIPEAAYTIAVINELEERRNVLEAAKYFLLAGRLQTESTFPGGFIIFDEESQPVDENGHWTDFELLGQYISELSHDKRLELMELIKDSPVVVE